MDAVYTGNKIQELRKKQGLTQKDVAEAVHVTDKAVSKWERGVNFPDLPLLEPLAELLGTTAAELLGIEGQTVGDVAESFVRISLEERKRLRRELVFRAWINIVYGAISFFAQLAAGKIFADHGLYGLPQVLTVGMVGISALFIGNGIYILRKWRCL